jgi:hypothetical protein
MATVERRPLQAAQVWRPKRTWGGVLGIATSAVLLLTGVAALAWGAEQPLGPGLGLGLVFAVIGSGAAAALAAASMGYFRLRYRLDHDALHVRWAGPPEVIPFEAIDGVYAGQRLGRLGQIRGVNWPGYHVGVVPNHPSGQLRVFCTDASIDALTVIVTGERTLVLSPSDTPGFRRELIRRIESVDTPESRSNSSAWGDEGSLPHPMLIASISAAVALLAAAMATTVAHYDELPETISMPTAGGGTVASPRSDIFELPVLASGLLGLNLVLALALRARERGAVVLLCATACIAEGVVLLAVVRLLR